MADGRYLKKLLNAISLQPFDQFWRNLVWWWRRTISVSKNDRVTVQARQEHSQGMWKRWVFRRLQNVDRDGADVTWCGRPFQTWAAATGKARSPMVDSRVRRTTSDGDDAERRRRLALISADRQSSSARYDETDPLKHLCTRTATFWRLQSVQLMEEQCDMVIPWWRKHRLGSRVHRRLEPRQQVLWDSSEAGWHCHGWAVSAPTETRVCRRDLGSSSLSGTAGWLDECNCRIYACHISWLSLKPVQAVQRPCCKKHCFVYYVTNSTTVVSMIFVMWQYISAALHNEWFL